MDWICLISGLVIVFVGNLWVFDVSIIVMIGNFCIVDNFE